MSREQPSSAALARFFVRAASHMVPSGNRREWMAEWNAELCHVCRLRAGDPVQFSLGAFQDAFWLRSDRLRFRTRAVRARGSAVGCLLSLGMLAACGLLACLFLPGARRALSAETYRDPGNLVIISSDGYAGTQLPSISMADYREWKTDTSRLFTQLAFYRPVTGSVSLDGNRVVKLSMALASDNLPRILESSAWKARPAVAGGRQLFVRRSSWSADFQSDPGLIGKTVSVEGEPAVIAGIVPDDQWRLPGGMKALLIEDDRQLGALPGTARGFAIARLRHSVFATDRKGWCSIFEERSGAVLQFECISFAYIFRQPISLFFFALLLAIICLPATTALRLGDYPEREGRLRGAINFRRWMFLLAKSVLVVLIVGFWSIALAYAFAAVGSSVSLCIQMGTSFPALLFAFRWTLHDQRGRCPVCLRLLSNPARVGQPSCNFLAWCGTEWICRSGHGVLHIPELPTCWFSTQRWLCLDASWASLFPADAALHGS